MSVSANQSMRREIEPSNENKTNKNLQGVHTQQDGNMAVWSDDFEHIDWWLTF